jgi:hypothetical protein
MPFINQQDIRPYCPHQENGLPLSYPQTQQPWVIFSLGWAYVKPWRWVSHPEPYYLWSPRPLEFFTHHGRDHHLAIEGRKYRNLVDKH